MFHKLASVNEQHVFPLIVFTAEWVRTKRTGFLEVVISPQVNKGTFQISGCTEHFFLTTKAPHCFETFTKGGKNKTTAPLGNKSCITKCIINYAPFMNN